MKVLLAVDICFSLYTVLDCRNIGQSDWV